MTANQLNRVPVMKEDETERERGGPRLLLPLPSNVIALQSTDQREKLRIVEALLFAASEPLDEATLAQHFVDGDDMPALLEELQSLYAARGARDACHHRLSPAGHPCRDRRDQGGEHVLWHHRYSA